jgi:hypothetical protein
LVEVATEDTLEMGTQDFPVRLTRVVVLVVLVVVGCLAATAVLA